MLDKQAVQRAERMFNQIRRHFTGKCARINGLGDCIRLRFSHDREIHVDYMGNIICERGKLNQFQLYVLAELEHFIADESRWYGVQDATDRYSNYDIVVVRVPDHYYPDNYPEAQYPTFDAGRPYQRLLGTRKKAVDAIRALQETFSDIIPVSAMDFTVHTSLATQYVRSIGLDTYVIASPPYDQPCDGLTFCKPKE